METRLPSNYCWTFFCVIVCCHFSVTSASRFTTVGRPKGTIFYEANHSAELRERPSASIALALCMNQLEFSTKQRRMCLKFPKQFTSVLRGFREALDECRHQFRHNRWNCSSFSSMRGSVMLAMTRAFMKRGFKEVAFVHALIAASIARTVSLDCLMGGIPSCNRRGSKRRRTKAEYSRHNKAISHGIYISEKFLNSHKKSRDTPEMVKRKNYRVGRMVFLDAIQLRCKCHGFSGACSIRTCVQVPSDLRNIASTLKKIMKSARKVELVNQRRMKPKPPVLSIHKSPRNYDSLLRSTLTSSRKHELLYLESSPSFCEQNDLLGVQGISGRRCSMNSTHDYNCKIFAVDEVITRFG